jgi:hypothetical protein
LVNAKQKAQQAVCLTNLRQLGLANINYVEDYQREFYSIMGWGMEYSWSIPLSPYYGKSVGVQLCPAASRLPDPGATAPLGQFGNGLSGTADTAWSHVASDSMWAGGGMKMVTNYGSYAFNGWLYQLAGGSPVPFFHTIGDIKRPYRTPIFADALCHNTLVQPTDVASSNLYYTPMPGIGTMQAFTIARHGVRSAKAAPRQVDTSQRLPGSIDMILFDGHVEKAPLENLWQYQWSSGWIPKARPR